MSNRLKTMRSLGARLPVGVAALILAAFAAGYVVAAQPHMHNALDALQTARSELQEATHNKGGHRVKALELVNAAIVQVGRGIADGAE